LDLQLADGPLTGTLSGTTLTVAIDSPSLPLTLPGGIEVSVTGASLAIDEADGTLTLTGSVAGPGGIGGSLSVSIAHSADTELNGVGGTDLTTAVTVTGVPFLSSTVDLEGHLALVGGKVTASVTGTLAADLAIAPDLVTLTKGSSVTLSTTDGLALSGTAVIGPQDTAVSVDLAEKPQRDVEVGGRNPSRVDARAKIAAQRLAYCRSRFFDTFLELDADKESHGCNQQS